MAKIVILDGYTENPGDLRWDAFSDMGALTVYERTDCGDTSEAIARIGDADIVLTNKTPLSAAVFAACPSIRYVGVLATGYNVVDLDAARAHGVVVTNVPDYGSEAVAQAAVALLLEVCRRVGHHDAAVHAGRWTQCPDFCFWDMPLIELNGKTMGILGLGRIGQATARLGRALSMRVLAFDPNPCESGAEVAQYAPLETVLCEADVLMLHCPLTEKTRHIVRRDTIERMKDGVIIVNNSRGPLIEEADLAAALVSGKVYAAAVDVVSREPIEADNPLLHAPNCIITPHISWAAKESRARLMAVAAENLRAFLNGTPQNVVG